MGGERARRRGVYLAQTAMLVLYWHPFMAFLAPLLAGELLLTSFTETLEALLAFLGRTVRTGRVFIAAAVAAVFVGVSKAVNSPTPGDALASILSSAAVPGLLVFLWLRAPGGTQRAGLTLRDLLAGELLLTSSAETREALPGPGSLGSRTRWIFAATIFGAAFIGVSKAVNSPTPGHALASILSSAAGAGLLIVLAARTGRCAAGRGRAARGACSPTAEGVGGDVGHRRGGDRGDPMRSAITFPAPSGWTRLVRRTT